MKEKKSLESFTQLQLKYKDSPISLAPNYCPTTNYLIKISTQYYDEIIICARDVTHFYEILQPQAVSFIRTSCLVSLALESPLPMLGLYINKQFKLMSY